MNGWLPSLAVAAVAAAGALGGIVVACLPGFHVYSVMGLAFLCLASATQGIAADLVLAAAMAAVTAWVIVSPVPAILLSAPDESAIFAVLPGQRYLLQGRGLEAIHLTALGSAGALVALIPLGALLAPGLPTLHRVLAPHYHWILWVTIAFMLLSEWPQGRTAGLTPGRRLWSGLRNVVAGLATFLLAGLLGLLLFIRSPLPVESAAQGLMPAFAGLFAVPWLLLNAIARVRIPPQRRSCGALPDLPALLHGWVAGLAGGAFAAFIPVISGGMGGLLAGHALSTRDERAFLVAQGACRSVYYTGGLLLLFLPALGVARGGAAAMLKATLTVKPGDLWIALAAAGIAAGLALWGLQPVTRRMIDLLERQGYRRVSLVSLVLLATLVAATGGWAGLAVMTIATGIGLIPPLFGARRLNALGVILLPMACALSGFMPAIVRLLGLAPS